MGVTFRSGSYIRFVRIGGRTIKDGEAAAIWNNKGVLTEIIGPKRVNLFFSTIRFLTRHKAESQQYLVVRHRDGRVEHIRGPAALFQNPALHDEVCVEDGKFLKSSSNFVVVQNDGSANFASKDVKKELNLAAHLTKVPGPTLFIPSPSEHIHEFSWSQIDGANLSPAAMEFNTLRTSSYPMNVSLNVPLSNNHLIKAELRIEYKICSSSVEMLMKYDDPIARMHHALLADGQIIGDEITLDMVNAWEQVKMNAIFNNVDSYTELSKAAEQSGFQILSVSLMGHSLNNQLESLFNEERALSLELNSELKAKTQRQKLRALEQEDKMKEIEIAAKLKRIQIESNDQLEKEMHSKKIASLKRKADLEAIEAKGSNAIGKMKDESKLTFLEKVKNMDVDMTKFLISAYGSESYYRNNNTGKELLMHTRT